MPEKVLFYKAKIRDIHLTLMKTNQLDVLKLTALKNELSKKKYDDLAGFCDYIMGYYYLYGDDESRYHKFEEGFSTRKDKFSKVYKHILKAVYYDVKFRDMDKCLKSLNKAVEVYKKYNLQDNLLELIIEMHLGKVYFIKNSFKEAYNHLQAALNKKIYKIDKFLYAKIYANLGTIEQSCHNPVDAIKYYLEAEKLYEKYEMNAAYGNLLNSMGCLYLNYGKEKLAIDCFQKASEIAEKCNLPLLSSLVFANLGSLYSERNENDKAEECLFKAIDFQKVMPDDYVMATIIEYIGIHYKKREMYDKSIEYLFKAIVIAEKLLDKNIVLLINLYIEIADVYLSQNDYKNALKHIQHANKLNNKQNQKDKQLAIYKFYVKYYTKIKKYKKALQMCSLSVELSDEITKEKTENAMKILQIRGIE